MSSGAQQVLSPSNASLDLFPNNTLTHFTHRLPRPFSTGGGAFSAALTRLIIHNKLAEGEEEESEGGVGYIKVHLEQLSDQPSPDPQNRRCLARLPFVAQKARAKGGRVGWIDVDLPVFLPLNPGLQEVRELTFHITDDDGRQLPLAAGPATTACLEFRAMTREDASFSITLDNTTSRAQHATNTLEAWVSQMPPSLQLDSGWEVALHSVQVPRGLGHTPDLMRLTLSGDRSAMSDITWEDSFRALRGKQYGYLLSKINAFLHREKLDLSSGLNRRVRLVARDSRSAARHYRLARFNSSLCQALGLKEDEEGKGLLVNTPHKRAGFVALPPSEAMLAITDALWRNKIGVEAEGAQHVVIYTDLVEPSIIGNTVAPILEIVSTRDIGLDDWTTNTLWTTRNPVFRAVRWRPSVHTRLTGLDGKSLGLCYSGKEPEGGETRPSLSLTLVFRRRHTRGALSQLL